MLKLSLKLAYPLTLLNLARASGGRNTVSVDKLPSCDFCKREGVEKDAEYDGKTKFGPWANMCKPHFRRYGVGLGVGRGQKLEIRVKIPVAKTNKVPVVSIPLWKSLESPVYVRCPHCGEQRAVEPDANYIVTCESCENRYEVVSAI